MGHLINFFMHNDLGTMGHQGQVACFCYD